MNRKSQAYLKKAVSLKDGATALQTVVSCYADIRKGRISLRPVQPLLSDKAEKSLKYIEYFKKSLSGKQGSTAVSVNAVDKKFLRPIYESRLGDSEIVKKLCLQIMEVKPWKDNFAVLAAYGICDIPGTDESYDFIIITIQPCPLSKPEIIFDYSKNSFTSRALDYVLGMPAYSFLYPDIEGPKVNGDNCFFSAKSPKFFAESSVILKAVCDGMIPLDSKEQKHGFERMVKANFDGDIPFEALQKIYGRISELQADEEYSGVDVFLTSEELANIISVSGPPTASGQKEMEKLLDEEYKGSKFKVSNLTETKIHLETPNASIKIPLPELQSLQTTIIDGREYYLFPKKYSLINALTVKESVRELPDTK